jgi:hypothetical protein
MQLFKKSYHNRDNKAIKITLVWACTGNGRKYKSQNNIVYEFGNNKPRGRPRNRWQNEVREDGRMVGREEWLEKVCNRVMEEAQENYKESSHSAHANGAE